MTQQTKDAVQVWLDEAAAAMSGDAAARRDALLELETTIYERLDEFEAESVETVHDVLGKMGDPAEIGGSIMPADPLIAPSKTRHFFLHTGIVFAVHVLMVVAATLAQREFSLPPLRISPLADPKSILALFGTALHVLIFDAGLVLCGYVALGKVGRMISFPRAALAVRPNARRCIESAIFLTLVMVVVNFFRDSLLALYLPTESGAHRVSLVGPGIVENLLLLNLWLGAAIVRDLVFAKLGERRLTVAIDLVTCVVGLFCLLHLVASRELVDLSRAGDELGRATDGIAALMNTVFVLIALATAVIIAARAVRRGFRLAMLG